MLLESEGHHSRNAHSEVIMTYVPIFIGSPRKSGNTVLIAKETEKGLNSNGITTEIIYLNDLAITGCQACYACKRDGTIACTVKDDMQQVYERIERADGMIIATPIYFGGVTAQTKLMLDRLFPYLSMDLGSHLPNKISLSCIYTQNQPDELLFTGAMKAFEYALGLIGFTIKDRFIGSNLDTGVKPMITDNPALMSQAFQIGKNLIHP